MATPDLVGAPAVELAAHVRGGEISPRDVVEAHLAHIDRLNPTVGALRTVLADEARAAADALAGRDDLDSLPLAGVPVVIKDNVAVAGQPCLHGSAALAADPEPEDHPVVARLKDAGAIVVGIARLPELGLWGVTEGVHNPWRLDRTPGGSSGGTAAAVASAMVPVGHGNDGLGSIRIPSAACGLVGIKPGRGVIPAGIGPTDWHGMAENGPIATTVDDLAAAFAVLAGRPVEPVEVPDRTLRVAVSYRPPLPGSPVDREWKAAAVRVGKLLEGQGHGLEHDDPDYGVTRLLPLFLRWFAGAAEDLEVLSLQPGARLQRRARTHAALGRLVSRWIDPAQPERFVAAVEPFFDRYDVLVTPTLASPPIAADGWEHRGWLANVTSQARYAPMAAPWNFARFPAMAVPAGQHTDGTPLSVQLVARPGNEALLLSVAKQIEQLAPWQRHAPLASTG